jgi:hypothetical protein
VRSAHFAHPFMDHDAGIRRERATLIHAFLTGVPETNR